MKQKEPIQIYVKDDQYLTHILVQVVTKSGQYSDMSMCRTLIANSAVTVNGTVCDVPQRILTPGAYEIGVGTNRYRIQLNHSAYE